MKASELRIGNYVTHPRDGFDKITELGSTIHGDYAKFETTHEGYYFMHEGHELIEGVPISEEWLIRFGFVKYGTLHDSYRLNPFIVELGILGNHYTFRKIMNKEESILLKEIKYVHELQNLFFELKGKELELKS